MITRRDFLQKTFISALSANILLNNTAKLNANENINLKQRVFEPLLKNKNGQFETISWKKAYDIIENKIKNALDTKGVNGIALYTNSNISMIDSYAFSKLFKAGFRSNNIFTSAYNNEDISSKSKAMIYGITGSNGIYEDINNCDYILCFDTNLDENYSNKIINITSKNIINNNAFINLHINDSSYSYIINYIINEYLKSNKYDLSYLKKHFVFANYKQNKQWEISFNLYKKSFEKYTIDYTIKNTITSDISSNEEFKNNIMKIKDIVINSKNKILSISSSIFNKSLHSLESNLLLESMHLLLNKHSNIGSGTFNISSSKSYLASIDIVGLNSNRLASNMYIKYNEHQEIANKFWNITKDTLNPISNTFDDFKNNILNNTTEFLWLNDNTNNINFFNNNNLFITQSVSYISDINNNTSLVLPTSIDNETTYINGDDYRRLTYHSQKNIPYGKSMSLLWQIIELSKRFTIKQSYKRVRIDNKTALKSVRKSFILNNFKNNSTLFEVFFNNDKLRLFKYNNDNLNSQVKGDVRNIIGSDGGIFKGYRYNIYEYLYQELRQFTLSNAYDLPSFQKLSNTNKYLLWPYIKNKQITYRFNPKYDIYALNSLKKNKQFSFYGKMNKNLPFGNLEKITSKDKKSLKYRAKIFTSQAF